MEKRTKITLYVIIFIICVLTAFILGRCTTSHNGVETVIETKIDTLYRHTVDTICIEKEKIRYKEIKTTDTLYVIDTILLVEEKVYEDSISTIHFHGINADIDSISYYIPNDTVFVNKETTITTIKKKGWGQSVGVGVGVGYGITLEQQPRFVPTINVNVSWHFGYHY